MFASILEKVCNSSIFEKVSNWFLISCAKSSYGYHRIKGPGWNLYALGATEEDAQVISHDLIQASPGEVRRLIERDFIISKSLHQKVVILHVPPRIQFRDFILNLGLDRILSADDGECDGVYSPFLRMVILRGFPGTEEFRETLIHELCHAYCHSIRGVAEASPWADEGYATLVVARVLTASSKQPTQLLRRCLEYIVHLASTGQLMSSVELMHVKPSDPEFRNSRPRYLSHSAILMYMFMRLAKNNPRLLEVCKQAVKGDFASADEVVQAVEDSTNMSTDEINRKFVQFCMNLIEKPYSEPFITSSETMVQ